MKKNKILNIINYIIICIVLILLIFLILKTNKLKHNIQLISWEDLVDITPQEKSFDLTLFQEAISKNIEKQKDSIIWIYEEKNIELFEESEEEQKTTIKTVKSLQWNGIIISKDWYIITNKHVVENKNSTYYAILEDKEYDLEKIRYDDELDLAVVKISVKKETIPAKIINIKNNIKIWDIVFALKKDPNTKETITKMWIINSKKQKFKTNNNNIYIWLIQTSTSIEPWFSGWPLINLNWEVVGINTAIDNIEYWASYSLPLNQEFINQTIYSIKESWKIIRPYIWINYKKHEDGILVESVEADSPAEIAWLEKWDIIFWINNNAIEYQNFLYQLYTYKINKNIILNIQKWDFKQDIQINLWIKQ